MILKGKKTVFPGVKVVAIRPGSLIFDVNIIYATDTPQLEAYEAFAKTITGEDNENITVVTKARDELAPEANSTVSQEVQRMIRIKTNFRPYLKEVVKEEAEKVSCKLITEWDQFRIPMAYLIPLDFRAFDFRALGLREN